MRSGLLVCWLIGDDAGGAGLLGGFFLLGRHGLIDPVVGRFQIGGAGGRVIAFNVGFFAIHQVHVRHGVVVVGTQLQRLIQIINAILNGLPVLVFESGTNFLLLFVFGVEGLVGFEAEL